MIYYICIFLSGLLLSIGLVLLKKPFFSFALVTVSLLNTMFDTSTDETVKQKLLITNLKKLLVKFSVFLFLVALIICVSIAPVFLYMKIKSITIDDIDLSSFWFFFSMIVGSVLFFIFLPKDKDKDYSDWSVLLHKMILDNYNISRSLFSLEKKLFKKKINAPKEDFVIVTGLARAGTTALTNLLFESGNFHSLSYANMPFLMAPNIWKKFYNPKKSAKKERAHGDKVMFGYDTIEALEEYFFKAFLNDEYIKGDTLVKHKIDVDIYKSYLEYQSLIDNNDSESTYLAKNNNFILRYESLRKFNNNFKIVLICRDPFDHALSLMSQHNRFSKLQKEDSFTLDYMNWLGHYEFGLNHKKFDFGRKDLINNYKPTSINYWLFLWIDYYTEAFPLLENGDANLLLVDYNDLLHTPSQLVVALSEGLNKELINETKEPFEKTKKKEVEFDLELETQATQIYQDLLKYKIKLPS